MQLQPFNKIGEVGSEDTGHGHHTELQELHALSLQLIGRDETLSGHRVRPILLCRLIWRLLWPLPSPFPFLLWSVRRQVQNPWQVQAQPGTTAGQVVARAARVLCRMRSKLLS